MRAVFIALALLAVAAPAFAQGAPTNTPNQPNASTWVEQLVGQMTRVERALAAQGFARTQGPFTGAITSPGVQRFLVTLDGGGDFRVVAVCEDLCRDLDLRIFDQSGALVSQNTEAPIAPMIGVEPRWTGPFFVEVAMPRCDAPRCHYASYVYARR